jgi:hypothetical protein
VVLVVLFPEMMIKPNVKIRLLLEISVGSFCNEIEYSSAGCSNVGFTCMGNLYYCLLGSRLFPCSKPAIDNGGLAIVDLMLLKTLLYDCNTPTTLLLLLVSTALLFMLLSLCCVFLSVLRLFRIRRLGKVFLLLLT